VKMAAISPFSGAPERHDLTPLEGGRGFAAAATSINLGKNRATPFSGETKAWLKGEVETGRKVRTGRPHVARFLSRVGHAHSALVAPLFWFFLPRSFSQKNNGCAFSPVHLLSRRS
jgi:hypothetical protein